MKTMNSSQEDSANLDGQECPLCSGYGYMINEGEAVPCTCGLLASKEIQENARSAGLPRRFAKKSLATYKAAKNDRTRQHILKAAQSYSTAFSKGEEQGLLLRGKPGSGKTHVAVGILKEVIRRGYSAHYANFNDLLSRIRDSYREGSSQTEGELLSLVDYVDLLVLDDVGAEVTTDWVRDRLYLIINRRYENAKATIITTNCNEEELEERIGMRTASRLYEMCSSDFPPFPEQDYRKAHLS